MNYFNFTKNKPIKSLLCKSIVLLGLILFSSNITLAQCAGLQAIGFNADNPDQILLRATADIPAGTVFHITDNEWDDVTEAFLDNNEVEITWTAPTGGISNGSTILLEGSTATCGTISGNVPALGATGEEFYILSVAPGTTAGDVPPNTICFGVLFGGTGSIAGITAVDLGNIDNASYNGSGDITDVANWTTSNSIITLPTAACGAIGTVPCSATLTSGTATCDANTSGTDTYTATFTFTNGTETEALTVNASSGTPNVTTINANGTITVTGIDEGTDVTLTLTNTNCSLMQTVTSPNCIPPPTIDARINEFAYDCDTNDDNEIVEIRIENAFTGSLSDLTVNLYNGNNGASYGSQTLDMFTVGTDDGTYTYYTWVPSSIQNGPDGISLDLLGNLIEFISYEGTFAGVGGPANGITSTDVGVVQSNSTTCDMTIQRSADGTSWSQMAATTGNANNASATCTATLTAGTGVCDAMTAGVDTYTAIFVFTIGSESTALTVSASSGTADVTTINADGTITVTGINEGTDVTLTLTNTNCSLIQTVTSPTCTAIVPSGITAIGTCSGITASNENNFNIRITGLTSTSNYDFDFDGNGTADVAGITGVTSYTTTSSFAFSDGTASQMVQIDEGADGSYETMIVVHEVLCTDADDDGDLDFDSGCDLDLAAADKGYIVATAAPYTGTNTYVYVLTNINNNALAANTSGLFTGLANGGNGATNDYNVVAFNFASSVDATAFIASLTLSSSGTMVTTSTSSTGCSMACGTMAYNIECCIDPVATVNDPTICEGSTSTTLNLTVTSGMPVSYSIDFDDAAIADVPSTTLPASNMITVTLPNSLAPGTYTGTITYMEAPGCQGTDMFTITIDPAPTATAGSDEAICSSSTTFNLSLASTTATASNGTIAWSTSGNGTFDDNTLLTPVYTPSTDDVTAGSVTLTITVTSTGAGGCPPTSDMMTLTINPVVIVEAGTGSTICSTGSIDLTTLGASITGGTMAGTWSSTTGGTFDDGAGAFGTATTYNPSAAEVAAGVVTLTLASVDPSGPCPSASDTVTIPISNVSCGTFPWDGN